MFSSVKNNMKNKFHMFLLFVFVWLIGWLYTLGVMAHAAINVDKEILLGVSDIVRSFFLWPLILGIAYSP